MKKVGILSMQRIRNYGSFLQAYGLKKILEGIGCDVEFVDYHVDEPIVKDAAKEKNIFEKGIETLNGNAKLWHKFQYIIYKQNFSKNFKYLELPKEYNYCPKLNTLVIGSDEVFNLIQSNKNVGYSLELLGKDNRADRVITYAASFGNTTIEKINKYEKKDEISNLLKNIDSISVRDKNSYEIVKKLTEINPQINLDPVLIFDYMNSELVPQIRTKEKYIIIYAYNNRINKEEALEIKKIANKKGYKIYSIGGTQPYADKFIDCTPFEVLAYFKNAEFIITDTFHGSIFSIICNKQFVTIVRKSEGNKYGNEEKLTFLLENLNLKSRIVYDYKKIEKVISEKINFEKTNEIISEERKKAMKYLKENI